MAVISLVYSTSVLLNQPDIGMTWSYRTGIILSINEGGPADGILHVNDKIISISGMSPFTAQGMPEIKAGDFLEITYQHENAVHQSFLQLQKPDIKTICIRLIPIAVSSSYLFFGILSLKYSRLEKKFSAFIWFLLLFSVNLCLGSISNETSGNISPLFNFTVLWIGPLCLHTHIILAERNKSATEKAIVIGMYAVAFMVMIINVSGESWYKRGSQEITLSWFATNLILSAIVLAIGPGQNLNRSLQRKRRVASLSALLAFMPFIALSLLPHMFVGYYLIPYEFTSLFFPFLPIGYIFTIFREKFNKIENHLNKNMAWALDILILSIFLTFSLNLLSTYICLGDEANLLFQILLACLALVFLIPLYKFIQKAINQIFYGGWYDDQVLVEQIQNLIDSQDDIQNFLSKLCTTLEQTLSVESVVLVTRNGLLFTTHSDGSQITNSTQTVNLDHYFSNISRIFGREIGVGSDLQDLLNIPQSWEYRGHYDDCWVLLKGKTGYTGLLILGQHINGGDFIHKNLEQLRGVLQQSGPVIENLLLLEAINEHSSLIKQLHRKLLLATDEERKRISRNLHDQIIQSLVGVNYHLSDYRKKENKSFSQDLFSIQSEIRNVISDVRLICSELRPPALDAIGLIPTIRSMIADLNEGAPYSISFEVTGDESINLSEQVTLCIFRFFQEAMRNVQKHSLANIVSVKFLIKPEDSFDLTIIDDGQGFVLPEHLGKFAATKHFGLIGIEEQVEAIGGSLLITTAPGKGCRITVRIPFVER